MGTIKTKDSGLSRLAKELRKAATLGAGLILTASMAVAQQNIILARNDAVDVPNTASSAKQEQKAAKDRLNFGVWETTNWGGYVTESDFKNPKANINGVSADWYAPIPSEKDIKTRTYTMQFIAIRSALSSLDDTVDKSLLQLGTLMTTDNGKVEYYAFFERKPEDRAIHVLELPMNPGDEIFAAVTNTLTKVNGKTYWTLEMENFTQHKNVRFNVPYDGSNRAALFVLERPTVNGELSNMASIEEISMNGCSVLIGDKYESKKLIEMPHKSIHLMDADNNLLYTETPVNNENGTSFKIKNLKYSDISKLVR